jgi:hypothetical protein
MIEVKDMEEAIDRIARSSDGKMLYLLLQRRLMALPSTTDAYALPLEAGERIFAAKLIGLMAKGIAESDGHNSGQQPIVFAVRQPTVVGRSRGAGRRITDEHHVEGYDRPADE